MFLGNENVLLGSFFEKQHLLRINTRLFVGWTSTGLLLSSRSVRYPGEVVTFSGFKGFGFIKLTMDAAVPPWLPA